MADLRAVSDLFAAVWGRGDEGVPMPSEVLRAIVHAGGLVNAAYAAPPTPGSTTHGNTTHGNTAPLLGAAVLTPSADGGGYSMIAAALPGNSDRGIGSALKEHQRAWAAAHGMPTITWTFDPLVARNGHFNLDKLGAVGAHYERSFYGTMGDVINGNDESDRLVAVWSTTAPTPSRTESPSRDHSASLLAGPDGLPAYLSGAGTPGTLGARAGRHRRDPSRRPHDGHPLAAGRAGGDGGRLRPTLRGDRGQPRPLVSLHPCPGPRGGPMRIARLEVIWLKVPLVTPFRTSFGTAHDKDTFLVRLETTDGTVGWAECAAELDPLYSAEWLDGCEQVLRRELVPRLLALGDRLTAGRVATAPRAGDGQLHGQARHRDRSSRRRTQGGGLVLRAPSRGPSRSASRPGSRWGSWTRSPSCSTMSSATWTRATCGSSSRSSRAGTSQLCVPSANASGTRSCSRSTPMLPTPWPTRPSSPASTPSTCSSSSSPSRPTTSAATLASPP
jgi:predicted GNAT superfamily acetyltransferase